MNKLSTADQKKKQKQNQKHPTTKCFQILMSFCLSYPKLLDSPIVLVDGVADWRYELSGTFLKKNSRGRFVCITKFSGDL